MPIVVPLLRCRPLSVPRRERPERLLTLPQMRAWSSLPRFRFQMALALLTCRSRQLSTEQRGASRGEASLNPGQEGAVCDRLVSSRRRAGDAARRSASFSSDDLVAVHLSPVDELSPCLRRSTSSSSSSTADDEQGRVTDKVPARIRARVDHCNRAPLRPSAEFPSRSHTAGSRLGGRAEVRARRSCAASGRAAKDG